MVKPLSKVGKMYSDISSESNPSQKVTDTATEAIGYIRQLFEVSQDLCDDIHQKDTNNLVSAIQEIIQGKAFIIFHSQQAKVHLSSKAHSSFAIQFGKTIYGVLYIFADPVDTTQPSLSPILAELLAQLYGWLLYTCEQAAIVQGQYRRLEYQVYGKLSKREQEVLTLLCRGFTQEKVANELNIAVSTVIKHKQRIYYQLGVHNENDALVVAYHTGIVSLVKLINERRII